VPNESLDLPSSLIPFKFEKTLSHTVVLAGITRITCHNCIKYRNPSNHLGSPPHRSHVPYILFLGYALEIIQIDSSISLKHLVVSTIGDSPTLVFPHKNFSYLIVKVFLIHFIIMPRNEKISKIKYV